MKITQFKVIPFTIPFVNPLQTSNVKYVQRDGVWIKMKWKNFSGFGEAAPLPGFSNENLNEVNYALEGFYQAIRNEEMDAEELFKLVEVHSQNYPSVRFAIETAIHDLLSQNSGKPMSKNINPSALSEIKVNGMVGAHLPSDGFKVMKVKVGHNNLFDEIDHLKELTNLFGKEVLFRLDVNGAFDLSRAIRFCKEMEVFNIDYIEQPLPASELEDLAELQYHTEIPIAVDESLTDLKSAVKIIEEQAAQVFIIKPMVSGGFIESANIIKLAKSENIRSIITSSLETAIGRMACLNIAASNEIKEACGLATDFLFNEETNSPHVNDGFIKLPNISGLGLKLEI